MHLRARIWAVTLSGWALGGWTLLGCETQSASELEAPPDAANVAQPQSDAAANTGAETTPATSKPTDEDRSANDVTTDDITADDSEQPEPTGTPNEPSLDAGAPPNPELSGRMRIPSRIEAEDFVRYNEQDIENDSGDCGPGPVDLGTTDDDDGACYVGWTQGGEWLEYDVWADLAGDYEVTLRVASEASSAIEVLVDDQVLFTGQAPGAGWDTFQSVSAGRGALSEGAHVVRVRFVEGQVNLNYLVFTHEQQPGEPSTQPPDAGPSDAGPPPNEPPEPPLQTEGCEGAPAGYALVWSDTFDYEGLPDPERWGYETGGDGFGNNELQYYTDARSENARVADGVLTLTARYEEYMGNTYTSAKLNSGLGASDAGTWNEGVFSIRAKLPAGLGTWPALWMMPTDCAEGWPNCGEIDIMESVGYDEGVVHGTIHTDAFNHVEGTQIGMSTQVPNATSAFHTYTLVWTTERVEWQVDGDVYHSVDREADWGFAEWPFNDKLWHLMINLAVGGDWGGAEGVDSADYPATFEVDSVCVYQ